MSAPNHPKRVIILDPDNPMEEISGEFFWREDHEAALAAARAEAYDLGYRQGVWATHTALTNNGIAQRPPSKVRRYLVGIFAVWLALGILMSIVEIIAAH